MVSYRLRSGNPDDRQLPGPGGCLRRFRGNELSTVSDVEGLPLTTSVVTRPRGDVTLAQRPARVGNAATHKGELHRELPGVRLKVREGRNEHIRRYRALVQAIR